MPSTVPAACVAPVNERTGRCCRGNHVLQESTALSQDFFAAHGVLEKALRHGALDEATARRVRALVCQAQAAALGAAPFMQEVLRELRDLRLRPAGFGERAVDEASAAEDSWKARAAAIKGVEASARDALTHFIIAGKLGFDSRREMLGSIRAYDNGGSREFSSQMQHSYVKFLREARDWLAGIDVDTGLPIGAVGAVEAMVPPEAPAAGVEKGGEVFRNEPVETSADDHLLLEDDVVEGELEPFGLGQAKEDLTALLRVFLERCQA